MALFQEIDPLTFAGGRVVETYTGSLGESVRTVVAVRDDHGAVIGLVSVGITTEVINRKLLGRTPVVAIPTAVALLFAALVSWLLNRRLRRQTHGLGPAEMNRMYEYHDAVLHSVDGSDSPVAEMTHHVFHVRSAEAKKELVQRLASGTGRRILFMRTKHQARKLARQLTESGVPAVDLHGNLSQPARDRNLAAFSAGEAKVLVATDIASRGPF